MQGDYSEGEEILRYRAHTANSAVFVLAPAKPSIDPSAVHVTRNGRQFSVWLTPGADQGAVFGAVRKLCWSEKLKDPSIDIFYEAPPTAAADVAAVAELPTHPREEPSTTQRPEADTELFQYPDMHEPLERFDSDDLDPRGVFALIVRRARAWVWVGARVDPAAVDGCLEALSPLEAVVVEEGREPAEVWDLFPDG